MISTTFTFVFFLVLVIVGLFQSIRVVAENQRMVVFRLGKFLSVYGPGLNIIVPFCDKVIMVDLNKEIPVWMSMSEEEINKKVREHALSKPL
jgi:regulator of protease activity HflC (stomatin/prohibitin superfamily)